MEFTYEAYENLLYILKETGYEFTNYRNWHDKEKCVILRHDIDFDVKKSLRLAKIEKSIGVKSTYFVLITSDFYNIFSKKTDTLLQSIMACGHEIGLHFDEVRYPGSAVGEIKSKIIDECNLLGSAIGKNVKTVSMHRPSKTILNANIQIPGIINSYGVEYFKEFKYLSDSRRIWREPVMEIIYSGQFKRLHILTHAFWYGESEQNLHSSLLRYINSGNTNRYSIMDDNFTRLADEVRVDEILGWDEQNGRGNKKE